MSEAAKDIAAYLEGLAWDGKPRLDMWMVRLLGARNTEYVRLVSRYFIMGMAARGLQPGCRFDRMLVLWGPQGTGKSGVLRTLAYPWFDGGGWTLLSPASPPTGWLVEVDEIEALDADSSAGLKAFLTATTDTYRPRYSTAPLMAPRLALVAATSVRSVGQKDRRFWPVHIPRRVQLRKLEQQRDQLFAEAVHRLKSPEPGRARYLPTEAEEQAHFQRKRMPAEAFE